ncbi:MAG: hypothetical protein ACM30I_08870 [Gemmatimonas sp.]
MKSFTEMLLRFGAICAAVMGLAAHYAWGDVLSDRTGRFSADFPGRAATSTQTVATEAGPAIAHIYSHRSTRGTTYTVVYSDYPAGALAGAKPESVYEGIINGAMGQSGGSLKSSSAVRSDGVTGREAVFESADGKTAVRARYFLTGDRLYQVAYEGAPGSEAGKDVVAFLDSFQILR